MIQTVQTKKSRRAKSSVELPVVRAVAILVIVLALVTTAPRANADARQAGSVSGSGPHGTHGVTPRAPGYLGIGFQNAAEGAHGVIVVMVDHDGPAGKAGLREGDVILSMNGQAVASTVALSRMIHDAGVGSGAALIVLRNGQTITVTAQLAYREDVERQARLSMSAVDPPSAAVDGDPVVNGFTETYTADPAPASAPQHSPGFIATMLHTAPYTGLALAAMEPQLAGFFGAPAGTGLLVHTVLPNSPAARAGLHAGDVVLRADSVTLKTASDWTRHLHASKGGPIALTVLRDKREVTLTITPEFKKHAEMVWPVFF
jgi:serine protease Do